MDVFQADDALAAALRLGKLKIDLAVVGRGSLDPFHALDLLQLALCLGRLGVLGAEPVHEDHETRDFTLLLLVGGQELLFVGLALFQVVIVTTLVADQPAIAGFRRCCPQAG